jgi:hypothetical protein
VFERGLQLRRIHARQHLISFDQISFVHEDFFDAARVFGGDVDLIGLDPAIARDDPCRQLRLPALPPLPGSDEHRDHEHQKHHAPDRHAFHMRLPRTVAAPSAVRSCWSDRLTAINPVQVARSGPLLWSFHHGVHR